MASPVILCVDDEDIPRTLRALVLGKQGYAVLPAASAAQALELLALHHVDLVLTDQIMPEIAGTELAKRLRASRPSLPIIIVSGVNEIPEDASYADRFVSKVEGPEASSAASQRSWLTMPETRKMVPLLRVPAKAMSLHQLAMVGPDGSFSL